MFEIYNQNFNIEPFIIKLRNNQLTLENILEEDEIINDLKFNTESEFLNFITEDKIKKLIDYSTKLPISDTYDIGYKYPFNATEILCSENENFQKKFMQEKRFISKKKLKEKLDRVNRIKKDGFIFQLFKVINKVKNNDINDDILNMNKDTIDEKEEFDIDKLSEQEILELKTDKNLGNRIIYENVDYLLHFLKESEEVKENYVLVGYFYKILNCLINIHGMTIVYYLFDYPKKDEFDVLNILVENMNRKSMCDIVRKLITFEDDLMIKFREKKLDLFDKILDELNKSEDKDKYNCICDSLNLIINNSKFFELFITKNSFLQKIYDILCSCLKSHNYQKYISILQLLIKINENILQHFQNNSSDGLNFNEVDEFLYGSSFPKEKSVSSKNDNSENLKNFLLFMFEILEKNKFNFFSDLGVEDCSESGEFISTFLEKQKKIGLLKIKQTEYILTLINIFSNSFGAKYHEKNINTLIDIINKKNILWNLHEMFFLYPHSNLYQNIYKGILEIVTNENTPKSLVDAFFFENNDKKINLIDFYIEKEISDEMKLNHPLTNIYTFNPCFAFLNSFLYKIYTSKNNEIRKIIEENNDIHPFMEIMVEEFESFFNYKLLYKDPLDALCSNISVKEESSPFGSKNIYEIFEENCKIFKNYKSGEDYKSLLEEKKKRIEKEQGDNKSEKNKENEDIENNKGIQYIDDLDDELEDEDPLFKVEKINLKNEKENFFAMLNKPTDEVIKDNNENDDNDNNVYKGRFNIEDLDEIDDETNMQKNKKYADENNKIENINEENEKINEDMTPNENENKIYHLDYNKIEEKNKENDYQKEKIDENKNE